MEKSARLTQLNRELEKPKQARTSQSQDDEEEPNLEGGEAPAPELPALSAAGDSKPSIRAALRAYTPPAPVPPGMENSQQREAVL